MRARGINYDTGFLPGDALSRTVFDRQAVASDMRAIARDLHCSAVRISGRLPERLSVAAEEAAAQGLEVWFAPFPVDLSPAESIELIAECAERAQRLRDAGAEVVLVTGCETSAFCHGFIPGDTYMDRLGALSSPSLWEEIGPIMQRFNGYLAEVAAAARRRFNGTITYASGPWEFPDWSPFDMVGVDAYRAAYNAGSFREELREHFKHGKPVAVTEFGTCAYTGAAELGGMAWQPPAGAVADEGEQVRYLTELLDVFEEEGVDTALWFTFAKFGATGEDDLASYGVVRMIDDTRWEPKQAFHAMARRYR